MIGLSLVLNWLFQTMVAFLAIIGFAIIFSTPKKELALTGATGACGWLVYLITLHFSANTVLACFLGTVALAWLARVFSFAHKAPATVYLICGIFPLVPGAGIYYTGYYIFMGNNDLAVSKGLETIKIAIAMALAIGVIMSLPRFFFTWRKAEKD